MCVCFSRVDEHTKKAVAVHSNREGQQVFASAVDGYLQALASPGEKAQTLTHYLLLAVQRPVQTRCTVCDILSRDVPLCEYAPMPECEHWCCRLCLKKMFVRRLKEDASALTQFKCCTCRKPLPHTFVIKVIAE